MTPMPRAIQVGLGAAAALIVLLVARTDWSPTAKMMAFAAMPAVLVLLALRFERRLPWGGPEPAGPDEVMPGARAWRDEFELAGYRRLGGFRWNLRGRLVISAILAPATMDRYAIVTDRVLEVASRFGERMLVTTNSGRAPAPADVLRQVVRPGGPAELVVAHEAALELLAGRGLRPDRFPDDAVLLRIVRAVEGRALRLGGKPPLLTLLTRGAAGDDHDWELDEDAASDDRIDAWLRAEPAVG